MCNSFEFKIDWLSFSFRSSDPSIDDWEAFELTYPEFWDAFRYGKHTVSASCRSHYKFSFAFCETIMVHYDPQDMSNNKGVLIQCPSSGLNTLCGFCDVASTIDLLHYFVDRGARCTRIDLAFDDFDKRYTPEWYDQHKWRGDNYDIRGIKSHANDFGFIKSVKGATFYIGSLKKRSKILRIYDKNGESGGVIDAIRYEFELHNKNAFAVVDAILNGTFSFLDYFLDFCTILDSSSNDNKCRKVDEEWLNYIKLKFNVELTGFVPRSITIRDRAKGVDYYLHQAWFWKLLNTVDGLIGENLVDDIKHSMSSYITEDVSIRDFQLALSGCEYDYVLSILNKLSAS